MSRLLPPFLLTIPLALLSLGQVGCTPQAGMDPAVAQAIRERLTMAAEPEGARTVYQVRADLLGIDLEAEHEHAEEEAAEEEHAEAEHDEHADQEHAEAEAEHEHAEVTQDTEPREVTLVGQIGGLANPWENTQPDYPFGKTQAVFFLSDPEAVAEHESEGHAHAPGEECSFCAAHAEEQSDLIAVVRLVDEQGKLLPGDPRQVLDLKQNDTVVVQGTARVLAGGMMVVEASGVYVRR